ncbi:MAG: hypothetical protein K2X06_03340 [Burkholderiales bacterium]|nr:hypothetical protein [Burkholderiales bacterium]
MGLVILGALALYLLISIAVVIGAIKHAKKTGKSVKRWGWGAVLIMYLIPFWDWIPTVAVHQYYCATESGFWVNKSLDQWKAENPGVSETLVANKATSSKRQGDMTNYTDTYYLNQRFNWVVKKTGPLLLHRWHWEKEVIDTSTNEVLVRYVDFSTGSGFIGGPPRGFRFWLQNDHCIGGQGNMYSMDAFVSNISQLIKGDK